MAGKISRRALLTNSAAAAAGVMGASMAGASFAAANEAEVDEEIRTYPNHVHTTDVLVIGSGLGGCMAAMRAMQLGASVTILDKAQYAHSGNSGMNWGHMVGIEPAKGEDVEGLIAENIRMTYGLGDQNIIATLTRAGQDIQKMLLIENLGSVTERLEDGTPGCCFYGAAAPGVSAGFFPRFVSQKVKKMGAQVFERTMLLDVLTGPDGQAAGGVALDLASGELHVFRAKAVILATGAFS